MNSGGVGLREFLVGAGEICDGGITRIRLDISRFSEGTLLRKTVLSPTAALAWSFKSLHLHADHQEPEGQQLFPMSSARV